MMVLDGFVTIPTYSETNSSIDTTNRQRHANPDMVYTAQDTDSELQTFP